MKAIELMKQMKKYFGAAQVKIQTDLDEAIDELEALNSKQSCDGCRYEPIKECTECIRCKRFCKDRYDKKHTN